MFQLTKDKNGQFSRSLAVFSKGGSSTPPPVIGATADTTSILADSTLYTADRA